MKKGAFRFPMIKVEGSGEGPDPAVFCPANGYLPPYTYFESPIEVTTVSNESIVFILDTEINIKFDSLYIGSDTICNLIYNFYDENGVFLETRTQAIGSGGGYISVSQIIPDSTTRYVKCIATLDDGIAKFNRLSSNTSVPSGACVVAIFANTPNLATSLQFRSHLFLKKVEFLCTLDYVSDMNYLFNMCGVEKFTMPVSMPSLTQLQYALIDSDIYEFIFPVGFSAPLLVGMFYFSARAKNMESFALPDIPSLLTFNLGLYYSSVKVLTFTGCENIDNLSQILEQNTVIEEVTLPALPNLATATRLFYGCSNLKKLTLNGTWNKVYSDWTTNCYNLRELHFPRTLSTYGSSLTNSTLPNLSILHVPDFFDFSAISGSLVVYYFRIGTGSSANKLKKVYGDAEFASDELYLTYSPAYYAEYLEEVNLPKLKVSRIIIGTNSTTYKMKRLTALVVGWTNSTYSSTSAPQIQIAAALDTAWINAMFTSLPIVIGKTVDVRYCDGYAGCNKTIATAKGWTVS